MTPEQQIELYTEKKSDLSEAITEITNLVIDGREIPDAMSRGLFAFAMAIETMEDMLEIPDSERVVRDGKVIVRL